MYRVREIEHWNDVLNGNGLAKLDKVERMRAMDEFLFRDQAFQMHHSQKEAIKQRSILTVIFFSSADGHYFFRLFLRTSVLFNVHF